MNNLITANETNLNTIINGFENGIHMYLYRTFCTAMEQVLIARGELDPGTGSEYDDEGEDQGEGSASDNDTS